MDQIFDRLGTLLKSYLSGHPDTDGQPFNNGTARTGASGDPDLDDAMDELDAFLHDDQEAKARLERQRRAAEAEKQARERYSRTQSAHGSSGLGSAPSDGLAADYKALGVSYGAPMAEVKSAYKRLLKQWHPDRHSGSPEELKSATETSARLNAAYAHIEASIASGKKPEQR